MTYSGWCLTFLLCASSCGHCSCALPHVLEYDIVTPVKLSRNQRAAKPLHNYPEELQYALTIEGKNYTVHLEKNTALLDKSFTVTYYLTNGSEVTTAPDHVEHCYYHGLVQGVDKSSVSVGLCSGIQGFINLGTQVYLIEPLEEGGKHALYRQDHLRKKRATCGHSNNTVYDISPGVSAVYQPSTRKSSSAIGPQRFVEMFLVVDNSDYKHFGRSVAKIQDRMLTIANHVDKLYRPLNVRVMLMGLEVWSHKDKIDVSTRPDVTLTRFLEWRQKSLVGRKKHDNAQFVTGVEFEGPTVGLATKSAICREGSGAVNEDHNKNPIGVASTIAHEMGHNLGMSHDSPHCACGPLLASKNCVMSEAVGFVYPEAFSTCSQEELRVFLDHTNPSCLLDRPSTEQLFGGPVCGNAFVEAGEECDCGTVEECRDPCCNASTCRLAEGAQCAQGECCHQCQVKAAGSLCRPSAGDCDLDEYCTGQTAHCPKDAFKMNGVSCNTGKGYCYNGHCPTLQQHCQRLWGAGAHVGADGCFHQNTQGSEQAHCRKGKYGYEKCHVRDMKCGKIFCTGGAEFPITGKKVTLTLGFRAVCKLAVDPSQEEDLGMVPTGTKCGHNKVCFNNICQDIKVYGTGNCSAKCNNRGICNHEGQCHCQPGWAPPYCKTQQSDSPLGGEAVIISVSAVISLVLISFITGMVLCFRKKRNKSHTNARTELAPSGSLNPLFQEDKAKGVSHCGVPYISQPIFIESSVTQTHSAMPVTIIPSRKPPRPPTKPAAQPNASMTQAKPMPPMKPLPPLIKAVTTGRSAPVKPPSQWR